MPIIALVCTSLPDDLLTRLVRGAPPGVRVRDGAALLLRELPEALRPQQEPAPLRGPDTTLDSLLAEADVILSARRVPKNLVARSPRLRWIQLPLAGADWLAGSDLWDARDIAVTTASGINAVPVAEYAITVVLSLAKGIRRMVRGHEAMEWDRFTSGQVRGRTLGIIGYGAIGRALAPMARGLGMRVLATKRRVDPGQDTPDWVLPAGALPEVLSQADFVVLAVPGGVSTRGLIGAPELAAMKPSAFLINVARGDVVDEKALGKALREGLIAGAALDVTRTEPLPKGHLFWSLPNVLVTPHIAGLFQGYDEAVVDLFLENLHRFVSGRPLCNLLDRASGY